MDLIERLSYNPAITRVITRLRLREFSRKLYWRWKRPPDGILTLRVGQIRARFHIWGLEALRFFETYSSQGAKRGGEREILELLTTEARPGDVVFDIGSNVGLYAVLLAKAVGSSGKIVAFEPHLQSCRRLTQNLELNNLENVRSFSKALSDKTGKATLHVGSVNGNFSLVEPLAQTVAEEQQVEVIEGDRLREEEMLPLPTVVKIDVEGYEHAVIRGLRQTLAQPSCRLLCCEIHPWLLQAGSGPDDILSLVQSLGFRRIDTYPPRPGGGFHIVAYKDVSS